GGADLGHRGRNRAARSAGRAARLIERARLPPPGPRRLLLFHLAHLVAGPPEPGAIPDPGDAWEDVLLFLPDVLLQRGADLQDCREPPLILRIEPLRLLKQPLHLVDLFRVPLCHPSRELGIGRATLTRDGSVKTDLLDLLVLLELRLELLPDRAAPGRRSVEELPEGGLRLLVLVLEKLDRVHGCTSLITGGKQLLCKEARPRRRPREGGIGQIVPRLTTREVGLTRKPWA